VNGSGPLLSPGDGGQRGLVTLPPDTPFPVGVAKAKTAQLDADMLVVIFDVEGQQQTVLADALYLALPAVQARSVAWATDETVMAAYSFNSTDLAVRRGCSGPAAVGGARGTPPNASGRGQMRSAARQRTPADGGPQSNGVVNDHRCPPDPLPLYSRAAA